MKAKFTIFCALIAFFIETNYTFSANYYWVGGAGNWSDFSTHWATTSGGSTFYSQVPQTTDNVIFDANSFTGAGQSVTIDQTIVTCADMNWTGCTNNPTLAGSATNSLKVYGSLTFTYGMSMTFAGPIYFEATTTGKTVNTAGKKFSYNIVFNGVGGGWTLQDSLSVSSGDIWQGNVYHNNGTLNINGKNISASRFYSNSGNTRSLSLGASIIRLYNWTGDFWILSTSGLTFNAGTSTIISISNFINSYHPAFQGAGLTYYNLYFAGYNNAGGIIYGNNTFLNNVTFAINDMSSSSSGGTINNNNVINNLTFCTNGTINGANTITTANLAAGRTYYFQSGTTQTLTNINAPSSCSAYIVFQSSSSGSQATLSSPIGHTFSYITVKDMIASGAGAPFVANNSIDQGNNTNWSFTPIAPRNLYWVGGTGNWSDGSHWSLSSGGPGTGCAPVYLDNVRFDANSFSGAGQTVTLDVPASCNDMDWTGSLYNPTLAGSAANPLKIYSSLTFIYNMSMTYSGQLYFEATTTGKTVNTAGKKFNYNIYFNGIGGGWTLQDSLSVSSGDIWQGNVYHNYGYLNTNGKNISASRFYSNSGNTRTLLLGASVFRLYNWTGDFWILSTSGLTFDAGTSTIISTAHFINSYHPVFQGAGLTYYNLYFTGYVNAGGTINGNNTFQNNVIFDVNDLTSSTSGGAINNNNTFLNNVTFNTNGTLNGNSIINNLNLTSGKIYYFQSGATQTITTMNGSGSCSAYTTFQASSAGSQATISSPNPHSLSYLSLKDMRVTGTGAPFTATNSLDMGNNSGWTITPVTPRNLYWVGGSGNWTDGNHWSLTSGGPPTGCSPLYFDNVRFDANSFSGAGQTVTNDAVTAACTNMDWTGSLFNPTFAGGSGNTLAIYGSLTFIQGMNVTFTGPVIFEATSTGQIVGTAGKQFKNNITFNGVGGGWSLSDSLSTSSSDIWAGNIVINNGTFNTNNHNVSAARFNSTASSTRNINLGSSVIKLYNWTGDFWNMNATNLTLNAGTSTIVSTAHFINSYTAAFNGGGLTYYNLYFTGYINKGGIINGNNTFLNTVFFALNDMSSSTQGGTINNNNTFNNLTFEGNGTINGTNTITNLALTPGRTYYFKNGNTQTIQAAGSFSATGSGGFPIEIISSSAGSQATISKSGSNVCCDFLRLKDMNATGGATFYAGDNSTDQGNNSGWTWSSCFIPPIITTFDSTNATCQSDATGKAKVFASGGVPPYTYLWSTGATIDSIVNQLPGMYIVTVTDASPQQKVDTVYINYNYANPVAYNVTGGGTYCSGDDGLAVGLANSEVGVKYQLYYNGTALYPWAPVNGTGSSISFGDQTAPGTYTVIATKTTGGCQNTMTGSVDITINFCYTQTLGVSINTTGSLNDTSAILDISDTICGILIPRMDETERGVVLPVDGLLIYNTTTNKINVANFYPTFGWYEFPATFVTATTGSTAINYGISINMTGAPPTASSIFDVNDYASGLLIPRTLPEVVAGPATGLIIYNKNTLTLDYYNGSSWVELDTAFTSSVSGGGHPGYGCSINYNGNPPSSSAILDIDVNNRGILIPRLTDIQRNRILPATGLIIYNLTANAIQYYNGSGWYQLDTQ